MAPLSFLKGEKDKQPSSSPPTATPDSPSKYRPSRLLRRRPSKSTASRKGGDDDVGSGSTPSELLTASSTTSTFGEQQQRSIDEITLSNGNSPFNGSDFFSAPRRGSESASKRSGGWFGRDSETVIVNAEAAFVTPEAMISRRIADQGALAEADFEHSRPLTPPEPAKLYPTALSPPRRTIPRSPQPNNIRPSSPEPAQPMLQRLSSNGIGPSSRADSPTYSNDGHVRETATPSPNKPVSAAWLARKPSSSRLNRNGSKSRSDVAPIRRRSEDTRERASSSSNTEESHESEIDQSLRRRKSKPKPRYRGEAEGYEVEVICIDGREDDGPLDELRWEVVIRKQGSNSSIIPSSPQQLSTVASTSRAPPSASSINLSLSLNQPTGKLVFISFPTDLQATPTKRRPSTSTPRSNVPSTPPRISSPSTPSRYKASYPSPSGYRVSPPSSPRDMFTPRRTRMVTAAQLDGGLYAKSSTEELKNSFVDLAESESDDGDLVERLKPMGLR